MLDYPEDRMEWRRDLDPKIQIVRHLAREFKLELVPLDGLMNEQALLYGRRELTGDDGVHPTLAGANIIAQEIPKTPNVYLLKVEVGNENRGCFEIVGQLLRASR